MKAAITTQKGDPNVIEIQERPIPNPKADHILIKVKAFGLNRSELFTRQGHSPDVLFPRIQGIECVGLVEEDPSGTFIKGQQVAAIMGGMGRDFDGSYAEYTLLPKDIVYPFKSTLDWKTLGSIPEMFQTVSGSLNAALELKKGETLLIRGGTSSIGLLAAQLAKHMGATVIATSRSETKKDFLIENGADHVIIDSGELAKDLREVYPEGINKVLELIGTRSLKDSLKCIAPKGVVCMTGILGNEWTMKEFTPMGDIPSLGRLTVYMGDAENLNKNLLQDFIDAVQNGEINIKIDSVYSLDEIVEAHKRMENNEAKGKMVIVND